MMNPRIQVSAQFVTSGSGGIARCARLTILALRAEAAVHGLAVEERASSIGAVCVRGFSGNRLAFVAANSMGALWSDWVIYDFAGTARAHAPLHLIQRPYAVWAHGWEVWPGNLRDDYARALRRATVVLVNSAHTGKRLAQSMPDLATINVCQLGTEKDICPACDLDPRPRPEKMVLFVGRNDEMFAKGQDLLIAAWPGVLAELPDAVLCFVGGGKRLDRLRELANCSPAAASIQVHGSLSDEAVAALHRRARLFAMLSNVEGFGLVFAEAMSHGVPVLSSNEDASIEVNIDGETGFAVSRGDLGQVTETIVRVLRHDRLFENLSRNAYHRWRSDYCFSAFRDRFLRIATNVGLLRSTPANGGPSWKPQNLDVG